MKTLVRGFASYQKSAIHSFQLFNPGWALGFGAEDDRLVNPSANRRSSIPLSRTLSTRARRSLVTDIPKGRLENDKILPAIASTSYQGRLWRKGYDHLRLSLNFDAHFPKSPQNAVRSSDKHPGLARATADDLSSCGARGRATSDRTTDQVRFRHQSDGFQSAQALRASDLALHRPHFGGR